jgi:hypothetical protein
MWYAAVFVLSAWHVLSVHTISCKLVQQVVVTSRLSLYPVNLKKLDTIMMCSENFIV